MTEVCLLGTDDADLRADLFAYETAGAALSTYDVSEPYENSLAVDTVSLGAAVSLLNDLDWYLVRLARAALVREPSVSADEWLSRDLATAVREGGVRPEETGELLKVYGVEDGRPVEPMYVARANGEVPAYDLRDVSETLVVRVTESEFR